MLNYCKLLATGNWKPATVLSPSIRDTQYVIRSTKDYVRNYKQNMQNKPNFRKSQMNVNKVLTRDYEILDTWWSGKNEPKTNPNEPNFKKAEMNVTSYITVDYGNKPPIRAPKKRTQFSKRQKSMQTYLPQRIMKKTVSSGPGKTNPNKPNQTQFYNPPARIRIPVGCRQEPMRQEFNYLRAYKAPAQLFSCSNALIPLLICTASATKKFHLMLVFDCGIVFNSVFNIRKVSSLLR